MDLLYIPKKLKVGFQARNDTFDGKLSYIIYYDEKGVLRKEKSWEGWISKKHEPLEIDNEGITGLSLNKSIQRDNYHFGSGRNMIRVYDPRGFEYEITTDNLIGIINYCDLVKGELQGEYVYAWTKAGHLVLLPKNSEQYKKATEHTTVRNTKVSARDFTPGQVYDTKQGERAVYLGRMQYTDTEKYNPLSYIDKGIQHVFKNLTSNDFRVYAPAALGTISAVMEQEDLQDVLDEFQANIKSKTFSKFVVRPLTEKDKAIFLKSENRSTFFFAKPESSTRMNVVSLYNTYCQSMYHEKGAYRANIAVSAKSIDMDTTSKNDHSYSQDSGFKPGSFCSKFCRHYGHYHGDDTSLKFESDEKAKHYAENDLPAMVFEEWKENGYGVLQVLNSKTNVAEDIIFK